MSAEKGWIGEPQPPKEWQRSFASCRAEQIAGAERKRRRRAEAAAIEEWEHRRSLTDHPASEKDS
jgi:hypothetical protein